MDIADLTLVGANVPVKTTGYKARVEALADGRRSVFAVYSEFKLAGWQRVIAPALTPVFGETKVVCDLVNLETGELHTNAFLLPFLNAAKTYKVYRGAFRYAGRTHSFYLLTHKNALFKEALLFASESARGVFYKGIGKTDRPKPRREFLDALVDAERKLGLDLVPYAKGMKLVGVSERSFKDLRKASKERF